MRGWKGFWRAGGITISGNRPCVALSESPVPAYAPSVGGVAEWSNAPVLKTDAGVTLPWVRIPPPPPPTPRISLLLWPRLPSAGNRRLFRSGTVFCLASVAPVSRHSLLSRGPVSACPNRGGVCPEQGIFCILTVKNRPKRQIRQHQSPNSIVISVAWAPEIHISCYSR